MCLNKLELFTVTLYPNRLKEITKELKMNAVKRNLD